MLSEVGLKKFFPDVPVSLSEMSLVHTASGAKDSTFDVNGLRSEADSKTPRVAVLLATHDGIRWISQQVASILAQQYVDVKLIVSDDLSTDGTWEWLQALSGHDSRVQLLPHTEKFGGAAKNFYRLLVDADLSDVDFVALADQDDIWGAGKLFRQAGLIKREHCDAVSSNVLAFWSNMRTRLIVKSHRQRALDFLFESAGPGCSFMMSRRLVMQMRKILDNDAFHAKEVHLHDWLIYAIARASGARWHIDEIPSVRYRQHSSNELGVNVGWRAKLFRIRQLSGGWYRGEILKISRVCAHVSNDECITRLAYLLERENAFSNRLRLVPFIWQGRRKLTQRIALSIAVLAGML